MKKGLFISYFILVFLVGWFCHGLYDVNHMEVSNAFPSKTISLPYKTLETDADKIVTGAVPEKAQSLFLRFLLGDNERNSPQDRIKEKNIHVYNDKIVIDLEDASWSSFVNTNSMDPVFDTGTNGIEVIPQSPEDIMPGDVISYRYEDSIIAHRVIEVGKDKKGIFYIAKGDNNVIKDPQKIRFEQVHGVLVGLIY